MNHVVVLLARAPSARGKTRLTAHLPEDRARQLRERLLLDTLAAARAAGYPVVVSYTPDAAREEMRGLAGEATLIPQRGEDLGARMRNAINDVLATGAATVVLIGSDLPTLPPTHIVHAFDLLNSAPHPDVVLGPSEDGGFYLVGARGPLPDLFGEHSSIKWGRNDVLVRVMARAHDVGVTIGRAPQWWDVDKRDDLMRVGGPYAAFWG